MSRLTKKRVVYLDNAASTLIHPKVIKKMTESLSLFGNPSSYNDPGRKAKNLVESSRKKIADFIGSKAEEVMFTSSGSEANNLAIFGLAKT